MYSRQAYRHLKRLFWLFPGLVILLALLMSSILGAHTAQAASLHVDMMVLNGEINPASLHSLTSAIDTASGDGAQALVIEIDTPGGDIDSMKAMTQAELASKVPIIAYVSPVGGRAASAGAFVTLAAHIAAMAPTTRIGASSPVTSTGGDIDQTLKSKIENDLIAAITGFQTRYGRNTQLAASMVTDAKSYDDTTAVKDNIVDIGGADAATLGVLLNTVNNRQVKLNSGRVVTLQTAGADIQTVQASIFDSFYGLLLDPNISFLLFIVAMIGIYLEISHPGVILPGVAGAIALLLFLFSVGSLTPNWTGLGLMVLAFALLVLDVRLPTHGVLTIGAVISLIAGTLIFFNSGGPYNGPMVNPAVVYIMGGVVGLIGLFLVSFVVRAQHMPVNTGVEGMIGTKVVALTQLHPEGRVNYNGEDWAAVLDAPATSADVGSELRIVAVEGLRLHVQPVWMQKLIDDTHPVTTLE
ncbi:MAG TPA: nodulation protein NfeD [Ktedonobacteraceae bacterium]|nr:nodulation protein NfeD [Ktedonobacteraceae bacterium]